MIHQMIHQIEQLATRQSPKMKPDPSLTYQAYLLRLWRGGEDRPWRVSLTPVGADEPIHFPDLEKLLTFLRATAQVAEIPVANGE